MPDKARGLCGRSCEISGQLVKQYDYDTSFSKGSKVHIAYSANYQMVFLKAADFIKVDGDTSALRASNKIVPDVAKASADHSTVWHQLSNLI